MKLDYIDTYPLALEHWHIGCGITCGGMEDTMIYVPFDILQIFSWF